MPLQNNLKKKSLKSKMKIIKKNMLKITKMYKRTAKISIRGLTPIMELKI